MRKPFYWMFLKKKKNISVFYWNGINSSVISFHKYLFILFLHSCFTLFKEQLLLCHNCLTFGSFYMSVRNRNIDLSFHLLSLYSYTALHFPLFICESCSHWMTLNAWWSFYNLLIFHNIQRKLTWNKISVLMN